MPLDRTLTESEVARAWRRRKLGISLQRCADDLDVSLQRLDEAIWKWMRPKPQRTDDRRPIHNAYTAPSEKHRIRDAPTA